MWLTSSEVFCCTETSFVVSVSYIEATLLPWVVLLVCYYTYYVRVHCLHAMNTQGLSFMADRCWMHLNFSVSFMVDSALIEDSIEEQVVGSGMGTVIGLSATAPSDVMEAQVREEAAQRKMQRQLSRQASRQDSPTKKLTKQLSRRASSRKLLRQKSIAAEEAKKKEAEKSKLIEEERAETGMVRSHVKGCRICWCSELWNISSYFSLEI